MPVLFSPMKIGNVEIPNRFVNFATYECMANGTGEVSDDLIKRYERLAHGERRMKIPVLAFRLGLRTGFTEMILAELLSFNNKGG